MYPEFQRALLDTDKRLSEVCSDHICDQIRFSVYRNNVFNSLIESLGQTFQTVLALVGDDYFRKLATAFIQDHLPSSPVLIDYGSEFPEFINAGFDQHKLSYLSDVATLDWYYVQSANEADRPSMAHELIAELVQQPNKLARCCVVFTPPVRLLSSNSPVFSIWQAHQQKNTREQLRELTITKSESVILTRPNYQVRLHQLPAAEAAFISRLIKGDDFETALSSVQGAELNLINLLQLLINENAIESLTETPQ